MSTFAVTLNILTILATLSSSTHPRGVAYTSTKNDNIITNKAVVSRTITVDRSGHGDFTTVQQAIDAVPINNKLWILIQIKAGIYNEKVTIPAEKRFIVFQGESSKTTIITYDDGGNPIESTTFKMFADYFVARDITFKNSYNRAVVGKSDKENANRAMTWAPAALITGDKVSFRRCGFISLQDTLSDFQGRHYYHSCYIEGAMDFIWGNAQSFYKLCTLNVTTSALGGSASYITAQGRQNASENTGYVFHSNAVVGSGPAFLGRAYRNFSRVLFYRTHMENIVTPLGWDAWSYVGHEDLITYAEVGCTGRGADKSKRVKWEKELPVDELQNLSNVDRFINQDRWLQHHP